jgi:MFS family permease
LSEQSPYSASRLPRTFRALRHRNFRLFFLGQIVSLTGTWMQTVAQGWLVYRLTDSPFMLGLVNLVALLPVAPISLLAGVISDRFPRRVVILVAEVVLAGQALLLALLTWRGIVQVWHVMVLSFVLGLAAALEQPARLAFVMDTVGREDISNAVALNSTVFNGARIVGPALAGLLVAWTGEQGCFLVNALTYLGMILALLLMRMDDKPRLQASGVGRSFLEGLRYLRQQRTILVLLSLSAIASYFALPYVTLMPAFARDVLGVGAEGLGFLMTAVGVGAVAGALGVASLRVGDRGLILSLANLLFPATLVFFSLARAYPLNLGLLTLVGASYITQQALANALIQINTDEAYLGRVMSIFGLLFNGMSRVGALQVGAVAEVTGVPVAIASSAALAIVWGLFVLWRWPFVRRIP